MQLYSHKKFTIQVEKATEDVTLHSMYGDFYVKAGELICTDETGNQYVITEKHLQDNYIPIKKISKTQTVKKSPFEEAYTQALMGFSGLDSNVESDEYINGQRELLKK